MPNMATMIAVLTTGRRRCPRPLLHRALITHAVNRSFNKVTVGFRLRRRTIPASSSPAAQQLRAQARSIHGRPGLRPLPGGLLVEVCETLAA